MVTIHLREGLIGKIWWESVCRRRRRRRVGREEPADSGKKLLKRPTLLEDNDHPSLINDHQPEAEKTKTEFVKQNFPG